MIAATVSSPIVELSFKGRRRETYENTELLEYRTGEYLVVQADRGEDMGVVVLSSETAANGDRNGPLKKILRRASCDDIVRVAELRTREDDAAVIARRKIHDHQLQMKLIDVEHQFDGNRITFYFTAEQRVDFRELVKDLASVFRTRIELRQIGVRDEAGRHGGVGVCGRPLCCTTWIRDFEPITLKMAKEQNLSLSPTKLSGVCGRLKCCLRYELDFYTQAQKTYPRHGAQVVWKGQPCEVVKVDIFREGVHVLDPDRQTHWIALADIPEVPREDRLSFKKKKSAGGLGGCGNSGMGCGGGRPGNGGAPGRDRPGNGNGPGRGERGGGCGSGGCSSASGEDAPGGCGGCGMPRRPRRPPKRPGGENQWRS